MRNRLKCFGFFFRLFSSHLVSTLQDRTSQWLMGTPDKLIHSTGTLVRLQRCVRCHGAETRVLPGSKCATPRDSAGRESSWSRWLQDPMVSLQPAECPGRQQDPRPAWHVETWYRHWRRPKTDDQSGHFSTYKFPLMPKTWITPSWPHLQIPGGA